TFCPVADMNGPFPPRLVRGSPNRHATKAYQFELALRKCSDFIGIFKSLQNHFVHRPLRRSLAASFHIVEWLRREGFEKIFRPARRSSSLKIRKCAKNEL